MALPLSRNETHSDNTPVRPSTVDDLQDCIVGRKHGELVIPVPGSAFQIAAVAGAYPTGALPEFDGFGWSFAAAPTGKIVAPIMLPVGTTINKIRWRFNKGGSAVALTMEMRGRALGGVGFTIVGNTDTSSGSSWITVDGSAGFVLVLANQYNLTVTAGNAAHAFDGADVYLQKV